MRGSGFLRISPTCPNSCTTTSSLLCTFASSSQELFFRLPGTGIQQSTFKSRQPLWAPMFAFASDLSDFLTGSVGPCNNANIEILDAAGWNTFGCLQQRLWKRQDDVVLKGFPIRRRGSARLKSATCFVTTPQIERLKHCSGTETKESISIFTFRMFSPSAVVKDGLDIHQRLDVQRRCRMKGRKQESGVPMLGPTQGRILFPLLLGWIGEGLKASSSDTSKIAFSRCCKRYVHLASGQEGRRSWTYGAGRSSQWRCPGTILVLTLSSTPFKVLVG